MTRRGFVPPLDLPRGNWANTGFECSSRSIEDDVRAMLEWDEKPRLVRFEVGRLAIERLRKTIEQWPAEDPGPPRLAGVFSGVPVYVSTDIDPEDICAHFSDGTWQRLAGLAK